LQQTQAAFRALHFRTALLPAWFDVDTAQDLGRLLKEKKLPSNVSCWLQGLPAALRDSLTR
jgi:hypothetical protein